MKKPNRSEGWERAIQFLGTWKEERNTNMFVPPMGEQQNTH